MVRRLESKQQVELRHEYKHRVSPYEDPVLSRRLRHLFPHDPHAGENGIYRITSLYFDTPYDKAFHQKLDGILNREKFRLRFYGDDIHSVRLEKKFKFDHLGGKRKAELTIAEVERLLSGDHSFLRESDDPLLVEFYSKMEGELLRPKVIVTYEREAFHYPVADVRITLDRNVATSLTSVNLFDLTRADLSVVDDDETILEVKYDEFLPDIVRMAVQTTGSRTTSYSKYAASRRYDPRM